MIAATKRFAAILAAATAASAFVATASFAHHSNAMFDQSKQRVLKGVVDEFFFTSPHSYLQLIVKTSSGREQNWTIEFQSAVRIREAGVRPDTFTRGDELTVIVHPLRNGTTGGNFVGLAWPDGRTLGDVSALDSNTPAASE